MRVPLEIQGTKNFVEAESDETLRRMRSMVEIVLGVRWIPDGCATIAAILREMRGGFNMWGWASWLDGALSARPE